MASAIKFGTDGWRAIIADDFTFENVRRVSRAIANYIHRHEDPARGVLLAYDTRFGSRRFAEVAAEQLADSGLHVRLANDYTPTPALSYAVKQMGAAGGVMITSSHNPWNWNGVKFKASYGGSATPEIMRKIEGYLDAPATRAQGGRSERDRFQSALCRRHREIRRYRPHLQGGLSLRHRRHVRLPGGECWRASSRRPEFRTWRFAER